MLYKVLDQISFGFLCSDRIYVILTYIYEQNHIQKPNASNVCALKHPSYKVNMISENSQELNDDECFYTRMANMINHKSIKRSKAETLIFFVQF